MSLDRLSDLEILLIVLAAFYVGECLAWLRSGVVWLAAPLGGRLRPIREAMLSGPTGPVLVQGFPWGRALRCQAWPVSLAPAGVYSYVATTTHPTSRPPQQERYVRFAEIDGIETSAADVHVNGTLFVKTSSPEYAEFVAAELQRLASLPEARRDSAISELLERLTNLDDASARIDQAARRGGALRISCTILFLFAFVAGPWLYYAYRLDQAAMRILAVYLVTLLALWINVVLGHARAQRALSLGDRSQRRKHTISMLLSPATAMHAWDNLWRHLALVEHPLAIAGVACRRETVAALARDVLRDNLHPIAPACPADDPEVRTTEQWFRQRSTEALFALARRLGLDPEALTAPPPAEPDSHAFCPRCADQYEVREGTCSHCGGLPLVPFRPAATD